MPDDAMEQVLRLVAEGRLTTDEAGPILDALDARAEAADAPTTRTTTRPTTEPAAKPSTDGAPARAIRIEVSD